MKNVHTEHCCVRHGCKYNDKTCPVEFGGIKQSFPCECCDMDTRDGGAYIYKIRDKRTGLFKEKHRSRTTFTEHGDIYAKVGIARSAMGSSIKANKDLVGNLEVVEFVIREQRVV